MSAATSSSSRLVKRVSRWSPPGHGDARPHSYPAALSTAQLTHLGHEAGHIGDFEMCVECLSLVR
jgi:hypothetical protein